ncbi:MAG TPA: RNA 2',3'-cyclic phosphodiesterase [Actinomycetota bacterium]|jgi:2'-5' RNA ligase
MAADAASRDRAKPLRLFVAVEIPDAAKSVTWEAFAPWRERFPKARWVPRENWHVTMKFLGATRPRLIGWVEESLRAVAGDQPAFPTRVRGLGTFPSARRARVVWAGLDDDGQHLARIARAIDASLAREFAPERRAFQPHLTVARSEPPLALPEEFGATPLETPPFAVDALALFRSHLRRPAPVYERLATFPLAG